MYLHNVVRLRPAMTTSAISNVPEEDWLNASRLRLQNSIVEIDSNDDSVAVGEERLIITGILHCLGTVNPPVQYGDRIEFNGITFRVKSHGQKEVSPWTRRAAGTHFKIENIGG